MGSSLGGEECTRDLASPQSISQKKGIDYTETFTPMAKMPSLRMLVKVSKQSNSLLNQMDVSSAYLHVPIDSELYVDMPKGFIKTDQLGRKLVWHLKKSLYGLKNSGHQ